MWKVSLCLNGMDQDTASVLSLQLDWLKKRFESCSIWRYCAEYEYTIHVFKPRYRQIHSDSDDHLKWQSSVIGSYPQWQAKEPQRR